MLEFNPFPKVPRWSRDITITEKIDGTNASVLIVPITEMDLDEGHPTPVDMDYDRGMAMYAGSRKRFITPDNDNFGFARWVLNNADELYSLGTGHHFGEWWGQGIQRGYGLHHKLFSLFNTERWTNDAVRPACCSVVPELYRGIMDENAINAAIEDLKHWGSAAAIGYHNPEGIMIWHHASRQLFKKTIKNDEKPKSCLTG